MAGRLVKAAVALSAPLLGVTLLSACGTSADTKCVVRGHTLFITFEGDPANNEGVTVTGYQVNVRYGKHGRKVIHLTPARKIGPITLDPGQVVVKTYELGGGGKAVSCNLTNVQF